MKAKCAQILVGLPGSGKSKYIHKARQHLGTIVRCIDLDPLPPPETLKPLYLPDVSVHEAVPTGMLSDIGIAGVMDFIVSNFDWLDEAIPNDYSYIIIDTPGNILNISSIGFLPKLCSYLTNRNFHCCNLFFYNSLQLENTSQVLSSFILSASLVGFLSYPSITIFTKNDLLYETERKKLLSIFNLSREENIKQLHQNVPLAKLNIAIYESLSSNNLFDHYFLNYQEPNSLLTLLQEINQKLDYHGSLVSEFFEEENTVQEESQSDEDDFPSF